MSTMISDAELDALLNGDTPFALIDVRESGEYNSSHIPGACADSPSAHRVHHRGIGAGQRCRGRRL